MVESKHVMRSGACVACFTSLFRSILPLRTYAADILALKHVSRILGHCNNPALLVSNFQASISALNGKRCHTHKPERKAVLGCCNVRESSWRALERRYLVLRARDDRDRKKQRPTWVPHNFVAASSSLIFLAGIPLTLLCLEVLYPNDKWQNYFVKSLRMSFSKELCNFRHGLLVL